MGNKQRPPNVLSTWTIDAVLLLGRTVSPMLSGPTNMEARRISLGDASAEQHLGTCYLLKHPWTPENNFDILRFLTQD